MILLTLSSSQEATMSPTEHRYTKKKGKSCGKTPYLIWT